MKKLIVLVVTLIALSSCGQKQYPKNAYIKATDDLEFIFYVDDIR